MSNKATAKNGVAEGKAAYSFKSYLEQRKAGKVQAPSSDNGFQTAQRGFWSKLKAAVHKVITVIVYTISSAAIGFAIGMGLGGPAAVVGGFVGGALGFTSALIGVLNNQCLFGPC